LSKFNISHQSNGIAEGTGNVDKIVVPTLVIQGNKDYVVSLEMANEIVEGVGDNAHLIILENSGHSPMVDCLEKLISLMVEFIN
jgi:pimeloyl-ACP methyl ester carboxylesterase